MKRSISVLATLSIVVSSLASDYIAVANTKESGKEKVNIVVQNDFVNRNFSCILNPVKKTLSLTQDQKFVGWSGEIKKNQPLTLTDKDTNCNINVSKTNIFSILHPKPNFYTPSKNNSLFLRADKGWLTTSERDQKVDFRYKSSSFDVFDNENVLISNKLDDKESGWNVQNDNKNGYMITKVIHDDRFVLVADKKNQLKLISKEKMEKDRQNPLIFTYKDDQLYNHLVNLKLKIYEMDNHPTYMVRTSQFYNKNKSSESSEDSHISSDHLSESSVQENSDSITNKKINVSNHKYGVNSQLKSYSANLNDELIEKNTDSKNLISMTISVNPEQIPKGVTKLTVNIVNGSEVVRTVTISEQDDWKIEVKNLPLKDSEGKDIDYGAEVELKGYSSSEEITRQNASDYQSGHVLVPATSIDNGESYYLLTSTEKNKATSLLRKTNFLEDSTAVSAINIGTVQTNSLYDDQGNRINQYVKFKSSDDVSYLQWTVQNVNQDVRFESNFMKKTSGKENFVLECSDGTYKCVKNENQINTVFKKTLNNGYRVHNTIVYPYKEVQVGNHINIDLDLTRDQDDTPDEPNEDINEFVQFTVNKKWDSEDHPDKVKVHLKANGVEKASQTLSSDNNWTYTWKNLSMKDSKGNDIQYTVEEDKISGYTANYSKVTNEGTTEDTVWLPAKHWKDNHEYIMVTSPNTGSVNALEDCGKKWEWNGHTINVSGNSGSKWPNGTYITNEEAQKNGGSFIWKTELYKEDAKIDHLNGLHDLYTLVGHSGKIASLQGAQDMVDYNHRKQTNCQWFYGDYAGGENQPNVPKEEWPNVMGGANFYYILSNGGTGDGNHKQIPVWYAYEKRNITTKKQSLTVTNKKDAPLPPKKGNMKIHKISSDTGESLKGAEFKLTLKSNPEKTYTGSTNNEGVIFFDDLPFGTYILQETKAPDGYKLDDRKYEIEVSEEGIKVINGNGNIVEINDELTISNKKNTGGPVLPDTGGPGGLLFIGTGIFILGIALICELYRRKGEHNER